MKTQHDKHSFEPPIKVGDKVFIRQTTVPKGTSAKLAPKFKGPFRVIEFGGAQNVVIQSLLDTNKPPYICHRNRLKILKEPALITHQGTKRSTVRVFSGNNIHLYRIRTSFHVSLWVDNHNTRWNCRRMTYCGKYVLNRERSNSAMERQQCLHSIDIIYEAVLLFEIN